MSINYKIDFTKYDGNGVRIAIIDSGFDEGNNLYNIKLKKDFFLNSHIVENNLICKDYIGHGTACAGIITKKAPKAELIIIKIFDKELVTTQELLISSIKYAIEQKVNIINLSLGTPSQSGIKELYDICQFALNYNIIIVAAENKINGTGSYPANFNNVLGVSSGKIYNRFGYFYRENSPIELIARGDHQRVNWLNRQSIFISGSSFAAPHISGIAALIIQAFPDYNLDLVKKVFISNSQIELPELIEDNGNNNYSEIDNSTVVHSSDGLTTKPDLSWIKNAVIYPFNKEMHSLIRFKELLPFNIVSVYDDPAKLMIGKDSAEAIGISANGIKIESINKCDFSSDRFDTAIFGYLDEISRIRKKDILGRYSRIAIENNKNVYSLSNMLGEKYNDIYKTAAIKNLIIKYPYVDHQLYEKIVARNDLLNIEMKTPILSIFGTSPQQGKFTTQLTLISQLKKSGYNVGTLSTEHQSELFGIDFTFPMGYESNVKIPLDDYSTVIRGVLAGMEFNDYDIILLAGQSGIIPYELDTFSKTYTLPSIAVLFACRADAFILCINYYDEDKFIMDNIRCLEALGKAKTILLVFSDHAKEVKTILGNSRITYRKLTDKEINQKITYLEDKFSIPATEVISESGKNNLLTTVLKYFS
jgi:uncharacterized NAD-dependent epimerase/dehydratase family protein